MTRLRWILALALLSPAAAVLAQQQDPREQSYQFYVDGVLTAGVVGYKIEFNNDPIAYTDARRLDQAYSPDVRRLTIVGTQKLLNRLMDWLNGATDTGAPVTRNVSLLVRASDNTILARWEFTGVTPATFNSAATGSVSQADASIQFAYATMKLVQAAAN